MAMRTKNPKAGDWDYDGCCAPGGYMDGCLTFSVGIFQWVPYASGVGIKHGKVVKRIRGYSSEPSKVYAKAEAWIKEREA